MLRDAGALVGLRALAARAATPVVCDHVSNPGEPLDRLGPRERRAAGAVDAEDRIAAAVLFVVEADPVEMLPGDRGELPQDRPQLVGEGLRTLEVRGVVTGDPLHRQSELLREARRSPAELRRPVSADQDPHGHAGGPDPFLVWNVSDKRLKLLGEEVRAIAEDALPELRIERLEARVRGVRTDERFHRAARIDGGELDDRLQINVSRSRLAGQRDQRRLMHDRAAEELGTPRHQLERDVAAPAGAKHDRGGQLELLDQLSRVVSLRGDRHDLSIRQARASRAATAIVGHGGEFIVESRGGPREVPGVPARARDEQHRRPGATHVVVQIGENARRSRHGVPPGFG